MDKLGVNLGFFLFQVFNFTIMAVLLYAWGYKPILKMLRLAVKKLPKDLKMPRWQLKHVQMPNRKQLKLLPMHNRKQLRFFAKPPNEQIGWS